MSYVYVCSLFFNVKFQPIFLGLIKPTYYRVFKVKFLEIEFTCDKMNKHILKVQFEEF